MLIDSHCHLDFPDYREDLPEVIARARRAGVGGMLTIGTHVSKFAAVRAVAEAHEDIWCTVGIHPHEAGREPPVTPEQLVALADHPKVVGFGETGLDFFYMHSPRADQERSFRVHIEAARRAGLPVVVHTRDADEDTIRILADEYRKGAFTGLIHCYSSGPQIAEKAMELGLYISLSGILTFKQAEELRQTAKSLPLDRVLVETDAPFLAPMPFRGKRNEPAYVVHTAAKLAELLGVGPESLAEASTANFFRLFAKAKTGESPCA